MSLAAFDVGTKTLSVCVTSKDLCSLYFIREINIFEFDIQNPNKEPDPKPPKVHYNCCGLNVNGTNCQLKGSFVIECPLGFYYFCKKHSVLSSTIWNESMTENLWTRITKENINSFQFSINHQCCYQDCQKNVIWICIVNNNVYSYCSIHRATELRLQKKNFTIKEISTEKKKKAYSYTNDQIHRYMYNVLQYLLQVFINFNVEDIGIESQPHELNPKMKTVSNFIHNYFMIKMLEGQIPLLKKIRFISADNKLKLDGINLPIEVIREKEIKKQNNKFNPFKPKVKKKTKQINDNQLEELNNQNETQIEESKEKKDKLYQVTKEISLEIVILKLFLTNQWNLIGKTITYETIRRLTTSKSAPYYFDYSQMTMEQVLSLNQYYSNNSSIVMTHNKADTYLYCEWMSKHE